jgi:integrase
MTLLGRNVSVSRILGGPGAFATKTEAKQARAQARERLGVIRERDLTVRRFWERWTTDPLFARPKESSDIRRREQTKGFVERYGDVPICQVGDEIVAEWLAGGGRTGTVMGLSSMFNDAASMKAGRLIDRNPFEKLGISRGKGRCDQQPPSEEKAWEIIACARDLSGPSFAAWLQVAAFTGLRPGELDALRWERIDFARDRITVAEQFNAATRKFDTPKNHQRREAPLTAHARSALEGLAREGEFCFVSLRGEHWTPSSRAYHWKAVRAASGWKGSLYLATRHFAGWYMVNVLEMPSEDVAIALGHQDGGNLVRRLYGHRDKHRALDRIVGAYAEKAGEHRLKSKGSSDAVSSQESLF